MPTAATRARTSTPRARRTRNVADREPREVSSWGSRMLLVVTPASGAGGTATSTTPLRGWREPVHRAGSGRGPPCHPRSASGSPGCTTRPPGRGTPLTGPRARSGRRGRCSGIPARRSGRPRPWVCRERSFGARTWLVVQPAGGWVGPAAGPSRSGRRSAGRGVLRHHGEPALDDVRVDDEELIEPVDVLDDDIAGGDQVVDQLGPGDLVVLDVRAQLRAVARRCR